MTKREVIEFIKNNPKNLIDIDKNLITENVILSLGVSEIGAIKYIFRDIPKENITKNIALKLVQHEIEIYDMLPEEYQNDNDVIVSVASQPAYLPTKFLHNKKAISILLQKWNNENSWALYEEEANFLIIKPDIQKQQYNIYLDFVNHRRLEYMLVDSIGICNEVPEVETMTVMNRLGRFINHTPTNLVQKI